jgi:hypothetical protein
VCTVYLRIVRLMFSVFMFLVREWRATDVASLRWFGFENPKGSVVLLPVWVVWFLLCWTHPSIWVSHMSALGFRMGWCSNALCFSDAPGLLRSAGLKVSGLPPFGHRLLIRLSSYDCVWIVMLERVFSLLLCSGGCWYVDHFPCWRLVHSPVKPFLILVDAHSSSFFVT